MPSNNPLSLGYSAIFSAINNWPAAGGTTGLFKPGLQTQVNMQAANFQPPTNVQAGDRPSAMLMEGRFTGRPYQRNSKAVELFATYPLNIRSGSFLIDKINLLEVVTLQALMNADGT